MWSILPKLLKVQGRTDKIILKHFEGSNQASYTEKHSYWLFDRDLICWVNIILSLNSSFSYHLSFHLTFLVRHTQIHLSKINRNSSQRYPEAFWLLRRLLLPKSTFNTLVGALFVDVAQIYARSIYFILSLYHRNKSKT